MANDRKSPKVAPTNPLWKWVRESREMQRRHPEQYLISYPQLKCDDEHVWMDQDTYDTIVRSCGRYDGTWPTGKYCGKMFVRGTRLVWFGIDKKNPMTDIKWHSRQILITAKGGPSHRPTS